MFSRRRTPEAAMAERRTERTDWTPPGGGGLEYNDYRAAFAGPDFRIGAEPESSPWAGGPRGAAGGRGPYAGRGPGGWRPSDARLRERICEQLMEDDLLDARDIVVEAKDGVVTLRGEVSRPSDVRRAEALARQAAAATEVRNALSATGRAS
jgi:hypothetical protein